MSNELINVPTKTNKYSYKKFPIEGTSWNDVGGNYIFAYANNGGGWTILYAGITDSFVNRLPNHERLAEAKKLGATHILAHTNTNKAAREAEEADIVGYYKPKMNSQLK